MMDKRKIYKSMISFTLFILLGSMITLLQYIGVCDADCKVHTINGTEVYFDWFFSLICVELKYLLLLYIIRIWIPVSDISDWLFSLGCIYIVQEIGWLLWNHKIAHGLSYYSIYAILFLIDSLFFLKMWKSLFKMMK